MTQNRIVSLLVAMNLRLGMPDSRAVSHARGMADLLADHCGGEFLYVARRVPSGRDSNDASIAARRAKGDSVRSIAAATGLSKSAVHRALIRMGFSVPAFRVTRDAQHHEPRAHPLPDGSNAT